MREAYKLAWRHARWCKESMGSNGNVFAMAALCRINRSLAEPLELNAIRRVHNPIYRGRLLAKLAAIRAATGETA